MTSFDQLSQIIPEDQALANKALAVSMEGIINIKKIKLPSFANTVVNIQTTYGLGLINAETTPVSQSVVDFYNNLNGGNTVNVLDILGVATGIGYTTNINNTVSTIESIDVSALTGIYNTMVATLNGVYGTGPVVIPSGPAAGTYSTIDNAMITLISAANTEIQTLVTTYPSQTQQLNTYWNGMASSLTNEFNLQSKANINYNIYSTSQSAMNGFISQLPTYGLDQSQGGTAQYLEAIADTANIGGQAVVGCLRQGVTQAVLNKAGIGTYNNPPSTPAVNPTPAPLSHNQPPYPPAP